MKKDLRGTERRLSGNDMLPTYPCCYCLYHFENLDDSIKIVVYFLTPRLLFCFLNLLFHDHLSNNSLFSVDNLEEVIKINNIKPLRLKLLFQNQSKTIIHFFSNGFQQVFHHKKNCKVLDHVHDRKKLIIRSKYYLENKINIWHVVKDRLFQLTLLKNNMERNYFLLMLVE